MPAIIKAIRLADLDSYRKPRPVPSLAELETSTKSGG